MLLFSIPVKYRAQLAKEIPLDLSLFWYFAYASQNFEKLEPNIMINEEAKIACISTGLDEVTVTTRLWFSFKHFR